jgi:putative transposase
MTLKRYPHNPPHLHLDHTPYFVTGAIYRKRPLLLEAKLKTHLLELIQNYFKKYDWELHHWVILDNHYHLLGKSNRGNHLSLIFRAIHSQMAIVIRAATACETPIWWNYWDYCPRHEADYYIRLNYLLANPVKHGVVAILTDYPHSSFLATLTEVGREQLVQQFRTYPEYKTLQLDEAQNDDF